MKRPSLKRFFPIFSILFFIWLAIIAVFILFPRAEPSDERKLGRVITECPFGHRTILIQRMFYIEDHPLTLQQRNSIKTGTGFDSQYPMTIFVTPSQYRAFCETCGCQYLPAMQWWARKSHETLEEIRSQEKFPELAWITRGLLSLDEETTKSVSLTQTFLDRTTFFELVDYEKDFPHISDLRAFDDELNEFLKNHSLVFLKSTLSFPPGAMNYQFLMDEKYQVGIIFGGTGRSSMIVKVDRTDMLISHSASLAASQARPAYLVYKPPLKYHIAKSKDWIKNKFARLWP